MIVVSHGERFEGTKVSAEVKQREFSDFAAFTAFVRKQQRRGTPEGPYVCAPMLNGHRNAQNLLPTRLLIIDFDALPPDAPERIREVIERTGTKGMMWTTRSSTPDAPRLRLVAALDRAVTKAEYRTVYRDFVQRLSVATGLALVGDEKCERPEQPAGLPQPHSTLWEWPSGRALDVALHLASAHDASEDTTAREGAAEEVIPEGQRDDYLSTRAFGMRHLGLSTTAINAALLVVNDERCRPPLTPREVAHIAAGKVRVRQFTPLLDILSDRAVPDFTDADLPEVIAAPARAFSESSGFAFEMCFASALACVGAACGDTLRLCLSRYSEWYVAPRLWPLPISMSGAGKTPAKDAMCGVLVEIDREQHADLGDPADEISHPEGQAPKRRRRRDEPDVPLVVEKRLVTHDATLEALARVLAANPRGLLYIVGEFEAWFGAFGTYSGAPAKDRGKWCDLYDGGPNSVDRVGGGSHFATNFGVTLHTAATMTVLKKFADKLPEDGLLQRFTPVMCAPRTVRVDRDSRPQLQALRQIARRLYTASLADGRFVNLTDGAEQAFREFEREAVERVPLVAVDSPGYAAHLAKTPGMCGRVALIFHAAHHIEHAPGVPLSRDTMALAIRFMIKARAHALLMYSTLLGGAEHDPLTLARAAARWIMTTGLTLIERRDLVAKVTPFRKAADWQRDRAMEMLTSVGWVSPTAGSYEKGHVTRWDVNPEIYTKFAEQAQREVERRHAVRAEWLGVRA